MYLRRGLLKAETGACPGDYFDQNLLLASVYKNKICNDVQSLRTWSHGHTNVLMSI